MLAASSLTKITMLAARDAGLGVGQALG